MVGVIAPEISVSVHIPCGIVIVGIKAVADIAAWDFLISHAPAIPKPQIGNNQNGLGKLNVQIEGKRPKIEGKIGGILNVISASFGGSKEDTNKSVQEILSSISRHALPSIACFGFGQIKLSVNPLGPS